MEMVAVGRGVSSLPRSTGGGLQDAMSVFSRRGSASQPREHADRLNGDGDRTLLKLGRREPKVARLAPLEGMYALG
jgi:hypothetical protein